jgi:hypothetical protein
MQKLLSYAFVLAGVLVAARWAMITFDDLMLKSDVSGVPSSLSGRNNAASIASTIGTRAVEKKCLPIEDGIEVDVAPIDLRGTPPNQQAWQVVSMTLRCQRKNALFMTKTVVITHSLDMMVPGGVPSHYP